MTNHILVVDPEATYVKNLPLTVQKKKSDETASLHVAQNWFRDQREHVSHPIYTHTCMSLISSLTKWQVRGRKLVSLT